MSGQPDQRARRWLPLVAGVVAIVLPMDAVAVVVHDDATVRFTKTGQAIGRLAPSDQDEGLPPARNRALPDDLGTLVPAPPEGYQVVTASPASGPLTVDALASIGQSSPTAISAARARLTNGGFRRAQAQTFASPTSRLVLGVIYLQFDTVAHARSYLRTQRTILEASHQSLLHDSARGSPSSSPPRPPGSAGWTPCTRSTSWSCRSSSHPRTATPPRPTSPPSTPPSPGAWPCHDHDHHRPHSARRPDRAGPRARAAPEGWRVAAPALRPLALRAGLVQGALAAALLVELAAFIVIRRAFDGNLAAGALTTGRWVLLVGTLAPVPLLALWAHRAAANLDSLGARGLPFSTSVAAWSWFVPIVNLALPLTVLLPLAQASDPEYPAGSDAWKRLPARHVVPIFWVAHILELAIAVIIRGSVTSIDSWWLSSTGLALVFACDVATLALAVAMVRRISGDQRHRATRLARRGDLPPVFQDHAAT